MTVCATLMLIFAADAVYSQFYPNTGEGITNIEKTIVQRQHRKE